MEQSLDSDIPSQRHDGTYIPTPEHTENRTMVRCLTPLHIQGFAFSCYAWVYVFSDYPFLLAWVNGGPSAVVFNWLVGVLGTSAVILSLAEVSSACPNIGGLYYFSARLAPQAYKGLAGFMTASCNIAGIVTSIPYVILQLAELSANIRYALTYDTMTGAGQLTSSRELTYLFLIICTLIGILASAPSRVVACYCSFGMFTNLLIFLSLSCTVLLIAPSHNTASFVFRTWAPNPAATGITNDAFAFIIACNMALNTFSGYDAVIYMTEECVRPTFALPAAMWRSFLLVAGLGGVSLLMVLFSIQDPTQLLSANAVFGGHSPVSQILWDVMNARFQSGRAAAPLMALMAWSMFLSCLFLTIGAARKVYAMSRDRLLLGSAFWSVLEPWLLIPLRSTWLVVIIMMGLGLALLADTTQFAFNIICDASLVFTFSSYLLPIAFRIFTTERLQPGPWDMGRWGPSVRASAVLFLVFSLFVAVAPQLYPVTLQNFPYTPVTWLGGLAVIFGIWYCPKIGAQNFYSGPVSRSGDSGITFAITSSTLRKRSHIKSRFRRASPCMCAFQEIVAERSPLARSRSMGSNRSSRSNPADAQDHPTSLLTHCLDIFGCLELELPLRWCYKHIAGAFAWLGDEPSDDSTVPALRIPGENEALSRAQKSPLHPAGYAWDKEAAKRLGHPEGHTKSVAVGSRDVLSSYREALGDRGATAGKRICSYGM